MKDEITFRFSGKRKQKDHLSHKQNGKGNGKTHTRFISKEGKKKKKNGKL